MLFNALTYAVQASCPLRSLASGVAAFTFFRAFGQSIGVAMGGTIFQNEIRKKLLAYPELAHMADEYSKDATALVQTIKALNVQIASGVIEDGLVQA